MNISSYEIEESIGKFSYEGKTECVYISLNKQNVCRTEIDNGTSVKTIDIDEGEPFAIVLPANEGIVSFYNKNGNVVKYKY